MCLDMNIVVHFGRNVFGKGSLTADEIWEKYLEITHSQNYDYKAGSQEEIKAKDLLNKMLPPRLSASSLQAMVEINGTLWYLKPFPRTINITPELKSEIISYARASMIPLSNIGEKIVANDTRRIEQIKRSELDLDKVSYVVKAEPASLVETLVLYFCSRYQKKY